MPPSNNPPNSPLYSSYSPPGIGSASEPTPTVGSAHPAPTPGMSSSAILNTVYCTMLTVIVTILLQ